MKLRTRVIIGQISVYLTILIISAIVNIKYDVPICGIVLAFVLWWRFKDTREKTIVNLEKKGL